jgi:2'-5' RNA ligase
MKKHAVWIMPREEAWDRLREVLDELALAYGGPRFGPHVTLLGGIRARTAETERKLRDLALSLEPFEVKLGRVDFLNEYYRCVFALVEDAGPESPIRRAYDRAFQAFAGDLVNAEERDFMPHLSLMYGDVSVEAKEEAVKQLGGRLEVAFPVRSLYLAETDGRPEDWRTAGSFPLGGASRRR